MYFSYFYISDHGQSINSKMNVWLCLLFLRHFTSLKTLKWLPKLLKMNSGAVIPRPIKSSAPSQHTSLSLLFPLSHVLWPHWPPQHSLEVLSVPWPPCASLDEDRFSLHISIARFFLSVYFWSKVTLTEWLYLTPYLKVQPVLPYSVHFPLPYFPLVSYLSV